MYNFTLIMVNNNQNKAIYYRKLSNKYQIAIPVQLMKKYNITPKSIVQIQESDQGIIIMAFDNPIKALRGIFTKSNAKKSGSELLKESKMKDFKRVKKKFNI